MADIKRVLPNKKWVQDLHGHEQSLRRKLKQCDALRNDPRYQQLMSGVNFETGRKIQKDGPTYRALEERLLRGYPSNIEMYMKISTDKEEREKYIAERVKDRKDDADKAEQWNKSLLQLENDVDLLTGWNDFVIFEGVKYGTRRKVINDIHIENDCNGKVVMINYEKTKNKIKYCTDSYCYASMNQADDCVYQITEYFKCDKCGHVLEQKRFEF